jgi:sugar lactone lactonase YvrE
MQLDRMGREAASPSIASGWSLRTLVAPTAVIGANGMRLGPDGELYVAQAFGSQISAVDLATGASRVVSGADGEIVAPDDLAFDSRGNLFVTEVMSARVSAIRPDGAVQVIAADVPVANGITVHADRIFLSEFNPEGRLWELDANGAAPRLIASGLMMPNALCLGPDNMLYFPLVPLGEIWRVALENGKPERVIGGLDIPTAVKFDAQGRLFVVESGSGMVSLVDPLKQIKTPYAQVAYGIDNFAFGPDGQMYVSHFTDGEIVAVGSDGAQRVVVAGGMTGPFGMAADGAGGLIVADGMSLASVGSDGTVRRPSMLLQHGFPGYVRGVALASDGSAIVTNSAGQCARYRAGEAADVLLDGLEYAMGVVVARSGDILVCDQGGSSGRGRIVAIGADGTTRTVARGLDRPTGLAEAPDGGLFVCESGSGTVRHVSHTGSTLVISGLQEPHGVAVAGGRAVVLDRGSGALYRASSEATGEVLASGLPAGTRGAMTPNVLPGIKDLMPGPLLPFADITTLADGSIALGGDSDGSILVLSPGDDPAGN